MEEDLLDQVNTGGSSAGDEIQSVALFYTITHICDVNTQLEITCRGGGNQEMEMSFCETNPIMLTLAACVAVTHHLGEVCRTGRHPGPWRSQGRW